MSGSTPLRDHGNQASYQFGKLMGSGPLSTRGTKSVPGPMSIWETRGLVHLGSEGFRALFLLGELGMPGSLSVWGTKEGRSHSPLGRTMGSGFLCVGD